MSASCAGRAPASGRCSRTYARQSGMTTPENLVDRVAELFPRAALPLEDGLAFGRQAIEAAPAVAGLLDPAAGDEAAVLEPAQHGIQRSDAKRQPAAGLGLDELADLVAMPGARAQQGQDQQLGAAFLQLVVRHDARAPSAINVL